METCTDYVMLVDDSEIDIFINKKILEHNQFSKDIFSTTSPKEALEMLSSAREGEIPDVLFLDLNMPIMDGFRFLEEFSKFPDHLKSRISIVVLTSSDNMDDKSLVAESNSVIKFMSKPLTDDKVLSIRNVIVQAAS